MTRLVCLCFPTKTNTQANILLKKRFKHTASSLQKGEESNQEE